MFSVVVLSKTDENLHRCVDSIRHHGETCRVIVVDDGLQDRRKDCIYLPGIKDFIFSRNANVGIEYAGEDVILMNDDATLETEKGFSEMAEQDGFGLISAAIRENVGNLRQKPAESGGMREEKGDIAFVCVLVPWSTYLAVGPLDERFSAYGSEDNDYCRRIRDAGLKIGIWDPCIVGHSGRSTFRADNPRIGVQLAQGRKQYREKWG